MNHTVHDYYQLELFIKGDHERAARQQRNADYVEELARHGELPPFRLHFNFRRLLPRLSFGFLFRQRQTQPPCTPLHYRPIDPAG